MGYYRGDYYRGDYYRGDPFLGAIAGRVLGAAGAAVGRAIRAAGRRVSPRTMERIQDIGTGAGLGAGLAGRRERMELSPIGTTAAPGVAVVPRDKLKDLPKGPRRRLNPLNPKALRRALRRAEGFEKFAARTVNGLYKVIDGRRVRTYKKRSK